jgi:hypothetical protein
MAEEHRQRLERALSGRGVDWRWVHRRNAASSYPTDFGLVQLTEPAKTAKVIRRVPATLKEWFLTHLFPLCAEKRAHIQGRVVNAAGSTVPRHNLAAREGP